DTKPLKKANEKQEIDFVRKHTRRFIFFQKLLGRVQFHFQSETEQSFLYDFHFCLFDDAQ
ncbi:hypothetical protein, partial [Streptococcus suis]|uniref:hypothetical protein n=1 Tax=Streptococcus suis TaxID=1307 RepID=UPI001EE73728